MGMLARSKRAADLHVLKLSAGNEAGMFGDPPLAERSNRNPQLNPATIRDSTTSGDNPNRLPRWIQTLESPRPQVPVKYFRRRHGEPGAL